MNRFCAIMLICVIAIGMSSCSRRGNRGARGSSHRSSASTPTAAVNTFCRNLQNEDYEAIYNAAEYNDNEVYVEEEVRGYKLIHSINKFGRLKSHTILHETIDGDDAGVRVLLSYDNFLMDSRCIHVYRVDNTWYVDVGLNNYEIHF